MFSGEIWILFFQLKNPPTNCTIVQKKCQIRKVFCRLDKCYNKANLENTILFIWFSDRNCFSRMPAAGFQMTGEEGFAEEKQRDSGRL